MTAAPPTRFDTSLDLLGEPLRARAARLRGYTAGRGRDEHVAGLIALAFDAAYAGDQAASACCLAQAETAAAALPAAVPDPPLPLSARTRASVLRDGITGAVRGSAGPAVIATDGSWNVPHAGWA